HCTALQIHSAFNFFGGESVDFFVTHWASGVSHSAHSLLDGFHDLIVTSHAASPPSCGGVAAACMASNTCCGACCWVACCHRSRSASWLLPACCMSACQSVTGCCCNGWMVSFWRLPRATVTVTVLGSSRCDNALIRMPPTASLPKRILGSPYSSTRRPCHTSASSPQQAIRVRRTVNGGRHTLSSPCNPMSYFCSAVPTRTPAMVYT